MFLRSTDLTTALRPSLSPDETLLYVQDSVGLYGGKSKLAEYQNGQAYLTSHRICYVDDRDPRNRAVAISLKDVDRIESYAGFLKSSPKITLFPKGASRLQGASPKPGSTLADRSPTPTSSPYAQQQQQQQQQQSFDSTNVSNGTWVCPICSFSNPVPANFDPALANSSTALPPCLACGIKPPLHLVVKAAITAISNRPASSVQHANGSILHPRITDVQGEEIAAQCPRCTFQNHPSLRSCEMCGLSLAPNSSPFSSTGSQSSSRAESPSPSLTTGTSLNGDFADGVKLSFRAGGEKTFLDRLRGALVQKKWLLQSVSSIGTTAFDPNATSQQQQKERTVGIAGLERRGQQLREQNEVVIGNAFEDLEALMASAKQIIALAEQFASQKKGVEASENGGATDPTALLSQLNLTTTKEMLNSPKGNDLYITELCRSLAEFLTDDTKGVLRHEGGIISLVDLWAIFNRARGGVELVSPTDLATAVGMFDKLKLPIRLRHFKSGLSVVQERSRTDDKTISAFLTWLRQLKEVPPDKKVEWDWQIWGRGVTAQETADRFGWSVGVANEELEMAEDRGVLCREVGMEGIRFWENPFTTLT